MQKYIYLFAIVAMCASFIYDIRTVEAQYSRESWQERFESSNEGDGVDYEALREQRQNNSRVRDAIKKLDDDEIKKLPIPILFGVSLDDLTDNFGDPRDNGTRTHEGLDILAPEGTPIVSPTESVVIRIGNGSGSGKYVSTANPGGETFVYMHLSEVAEIKVGETLEVGEVIGYVGNTGNASGGLPHLHLEIRKDRKPQDPLPRLTHEFELKDKIEYLEDVLNDVDDKDEYIEELVTNFSGVFLRAAGSGISLPRELREALSDLSDTPVPVRDLVIGNQNSEVTALQTILISQGYLDISIPTDYFGPLTKAALIDYQKANNIVPADGAYGPQTRVKMANVLVGEPDPKDEAALRKELLSQIAELTLILKALIAERTSL